MSDHVPVIAVDGPSASGKGVVSGFLARHYAYHLLDSGVLYRLVGFAARQRGISLESLNETGEGELGKLATQLEVGFTATGKPDEPLAITLYGQQVTSQVRTDEAGVDASIVAAVPAVRKGLLALQRSFRRAPGLVADGRDMGTLVFPEADIKFFLTASAEARAERRYNQLKHKGIDVNLRDLFQSIQARDERDRSREASPLRPADDAFVIDSTAMSIEEVLGQVQEIMAQRTGLIGAASTSPQEDRPTDS